jgi:hypothetical protein
MATTQAVVPWPAGKGEDKPVVGQRMPAGGILVLLLPQLLNYVVAIYLIFAGVIGLNSIYHFVR